MHHPQQPEILLALLGGVAPVTLVRDESLPAEWATAPAAVFPVFDTVVFDGGVFAVGIQLERDEAVPAEWLSALVRDEVVPVEWLGALLRRDEGIPVEWLAALARDEGVPVEWLQRLLREEAVPVEWQSVPAAVFPTFERAVFDESVFATGLQLDRDETIPVEWPEAGALVRDEGVPVEWSPAGFFSLARDEGVPVEWQVAQAVFVFLNWLAAGAGTRWPVEPTLLREPGLGQVWWTGWSRARWAPSAPEIPLVPGRVLPRRAPRPVARPPRWREVSSAIGIWGGRSRTVFRPSPSPTLAQDEDELMLLRRLLRGW